MTYSSCEQYICKDGELEELFEAVIKLPKLKIFNGLFNVNLSSVNADLLGKVVAKLEEVELGNNSLDSDQMKTIFEFMSHNHQLKSLNLSSFNADISNNMSSVQPA